MKLAKYQGKVLEADRGVDIKDRLGSRPDFRCVECQEPARVHRAGGRIPAHFEHLERNDFCDLVHQPR